MTRRQLAEKVGTTATTIYRLETGRHAPSFAISQAISAWAAKLGKTITWRGRVRSPKAGRAE
jgi:DNA-binding XRE family transcriptional regulator